MTELAIALVGIILVGALIAVSVMLVQHRAAFKHTEADLKKARADATKHSGHVLDAQALEHLTPFIPAFGERFNPRDARFLGSPIDYVVFDGLRHGRVREVVFVEVKTGQASLSKNERLIRDAIRDKRVSFETLNVNPPHRRALPPRIKAMSPPD